MARKFSEVEISAGTTSPPRSDRVKASFSLESKLSQCVFYCRYPYRPWPFELVVLQERMFIATNELAFATQFMPPIDVDTT